MSSKVQKQENASENVLQGLSSSGAVNVYMTDKTRIENKLKKELLDSHEHQHENCRYPLSLLTDVKCLFIGYLIFLLQKSFAKLSVNRQVTVFYLAI